MATDALSGSCDATWSRRRKPYLMQDYLKETYCIRNNQRTFLKIVFENYL
ncbi:hypothetical protein HanRHA438_Chr12g0548121 [Helianthus annuus]|nr:hypothetical protein HanRHA438_Chr12g0548121 [Helianthus annuus]